MNWIFETYKDVYAPSFTSDVKSEARNAKPVKTAKRLPTLHAYGFLLGK